MVTGRTSNDTVGPGPLAKRRRRKEQIEDDDSSELSDESDEDVDGTQRAAQQIRFAKMPVRERADSSPAQTTESKEGPDLLITSPSRRSGDGRLRRGSLGTVEAVKARARRDTTTSSDMSSENEVDPLYFQRRQVNLRGATKPNLLASAMKEEPGLPGIPAMGAEKDAQDDSDGESVASALSSELGVTADSASILNTMEDAVLTSSPLMSGMSSRSRSVPQNVSPKRTRSELVIQDLPPPRPISLVQPSSLLGSALRALKAKPRNPVEAFASLSGKGSPNPLWIKIYCPFSEDAEEPIEMPLDRTSKDGENITVGEAIGLALWRYTEEDCKPALTQSQLNANMWALRMVDDGEVEYDFPALVRTSAISDFTSNNNRGARARSREKPWDEFALVKASAAEAEANHKATPHLTPDSTVEPETAVDTGSTELNEPLRPVETSRTTGGRGNPVLGGQPFPSALNNTSLTPADQPAPQTSHATPRMGVTKTLRIRYFDIDVSAQSMTLEMSADSYIAEVLDHVSKRWNLDKAGFILKVTGTNTVAPLDRTVQALGPRSDLDLVRRRFGAGPLSLTGSPGSSSPNAPLLLDIDGPRKGKKGSQMLHPLAQKQDLISSAGSFKKYNVTRKQLTSFTQGNQRVLAFDGDFLHVMPNDTGKTLFDSGAKVTSIAFGDVLKVKVSSKHPKIVRVVVRRATESKRYDFEAKNADEAQEIVEDISREMKVARP
jgi:target of rapamycin complex 2 subunit MAPKAP1